MAPHLVPESWPCRQLFTIMKLFHLLFAFFLVCARTQAAEDPPLKTWLQRDILGPETARAETQVFAETKIPLLTTPATVAEWEATAAELRGAIFDRIVFRGEAARWKDADVQVEWLETIEGGPGYRIRKLRYEALPGLWIPALLYMPDNLSGQVPVVLNVNGHDGKGKAADYKQLRCINQAKRGMLALNPEWLGMGELRGTGYSHARMNQLDLCGTSGLAPFYLSMSRALDLLLALEHADPERVAVAGLSGGGWQTIWISSLDLRVKLSNPVAGYSSFRTRARFFSDLGDAEQTPCDMATLADYTHLTALLAPRPSLLTYNSKDNCCFASGHALPPLLEAAAPVFKLFGKENHLRSHINHDPGDHNFGLENREALYGMLRDHFYPDRRHEEWKEIDSAAEIKTEAELRVDVPPENAHFNSLALALAKSLPRDGELPSQTADIGKWQAARREALANVVRPRNYEIIAEQIASDESSGLKAAFWKLRAGQDWTIPAVELTPAECKGTVLLIADQGRQSLAGEAQRWLDQNHRVVLVDLFYFGESKMRSHDYLFALLVTTVGDRPLGVQAGQLAAIARWIREQHGGSIQVGGMGRRSSVIALVAAGLDKSAIGSVEVEDGLASFQELIERNEAYTSAPELFCFGLLESFDVKQIVGLIAPRTVIWRKTGDRARAEFSNLPDWFERQGGLFRLE
jgi:pimeloyl-ACP methyl ester carboxylesterase